MNLRCCPKDPSVLLRVGMLFLVLASLWPRFVRPTAHFSAGFVDAVGGLLYGVSIGCLVLSISRNRRRDSA